METTPMMEATRTHTLRCSTLDQNIYAGSGEHYNVPQVRRPGYCGCGCHPKVSWCDYCGTATSTEHKLTWNHAYQVVRGSGYSDEEWRALPSWRRRRLVNATVALIARKEALCQVPFGNSHLCETPEVHREP